MDSASDVDIRPAQPSDLDQLARLREALWPRTSAEEHGRELAPILAGNTPGSMPLINFVAVTRDGTLVAFAEVDLRSHADGCDPSLPAGYLEGWFVAPDFRRRGIGARLLAAAEDWSRAHGCVEMASDTWIDNHTSGVISEAILNRSVSSPRDLNPELPSYLGEIIAKALEKDRDLRCQTAAELRSDLKRLIDWTCKPARKHPGSS